MAGVTVDVWWPQWKLVVELDGEPYHATLSAFESDRIRDATLQKADNASCASPATASTTTRRAVLADILALRGRRRVKSYAASG